MNKPRLRITVEVLSFPEHLPDLGVRLDMRDVGRIGTRDTWLNHYSRRFSMDVESAEITLAISPNAAFWTGTPS